MGQIAIIDFRTSSMTKRQPERRNPSIYRIGDVPVVIRVPVDELRPGEIKSLERVEAAILAARLVRDAHRLALDYERRSGVSLADRFAAMKAANESDATLEKLIGVTMQSIAQPPKKHVRNRNRPKPSPPREIGKRPVISDGTAVNHEAMALEANDDVEVVDDRTVAARRHTRYDVFSLLYYPPRGRMEETSYLAVRRLQADMAILHRTHGTSDAIRNSGVGQTGALAIVTGQFALNRVEAGANIEAVLNGWQKESGLWVEGVEPWAARMLRELCEMEIVEGRRPNWHAVCARHTGEMRRTHRGELVIRACDQLAASYGRIDNEPKERAA